MAASHTTLEIPSISPLNQECLLKKNLKSDLFNEMEIKKEDSIEKHAATLFKHIYSVPYPGKENKGEAIARFFHGIQHVSRAAMYVPVFANLYRRYGDTAALALTPVELKLIQIAILFHDAGREGEEVDLWDQESALMLFFYLTMTLGIERDIAKKLAEAIANKDAENTKPYVELTLTTEGWEWKETASRPKNIYQNLIHDADCLDILRARDHFEADHLDFFKAYAINYENNTTHLRAFNEMAQLITEARSIIETQGDGRDRTKEIIKKSYETPDAYAKQLAEKNG